MANKISALIALLNTSGDIAADKVIQKLAKIGAPALPLVLEAAQNESNPHIRKWSLEALGALGSKKAAPVLLRALDHERMTVKLHAIGGLVRMKHKAAAGKIAALVGDESAGIRNRALGALIKLNDKKAALQALPALGDRQWHVRQKACELCGHFRLAQAKGTLQGLAASDERKAVREAAAKALDFL